MAKGPGKNAATTRGRPFEPGNPGRPRGARHKATRAIEALLDGEAEALTRKAIEAALGGDMAALRLCLDRIAPPRRERTVEFVAPTIKTAEDVPTALAAVFASVSEGDLTPSEGAAVASILEKVRAAIELADIERRLADLEKASGL